MTLPVAITIIAAGLLLGAVLAELNRHSRKLAIAGLLTLVLANLILMLGRA